MQQGYNGKRVKRLQMKLTPMLTVFHWLPLIPCAYVVKISMIPSYILWDILIYQNKHLFSVGWNIPQ